MNLVIYDAKPLHELVEMVNQHFSDIPNLNIKPVTYENPPYDNFLGRIVIYKFEHSLYTLSLVWQTPSLLYPPNNGIAEFIQHFFVKKGNGSLQKYLESKNLIIEEVMARDLEHSESFSLFVLQIVLSDKGFKQINEVIKVVFDFMWTVISLSQEQFNCQWNIHNRIRQINFNYNDKSTTLNHFK